MADPMIFPRIEASDLNGRDVVLPADLPGSPTLVLVAFTQEQQHDIDEWIDALELRSRDDIAWIELPVVSSRYRFAKRYVDDAMRSGIQAFEDRARTITTYGRREFIRALDLPGYDRVYAVVTNPLGDIGPIVAGRPSPAALAEIRAALAVG